MLFTEIRFFCFFLVVFGVFWGLRANRPRKLWLLVCSYAFYAGWDWRFLSLILLSTCVDYAVGRQLNRTDDPGARKRLLSVSIFANVGLLGFFKYFGFFVESAAQLLAWFGLDPHLPTLHIILPVGISFYTFQTLSYTIDVYRRTMRPVSSISDFALFVAFFPQLVAGPIVRASELLPQFEVNRRFTRDVAVRPALMLFLWGFFKKACLADHVSVVVDDLFADPASYSSAGTWLSLAMYHIQVYCDFSGYSDMAIATAALLGYRLTENFSFPYFALNIGEFWRRWHISLGSWLKDYVYFPLGGGRCSWGKRSRNVFITITLCGLWHGAGWQYIAFGLLHAFYVLSTQAWVNTAVRRKLIGRMIGWISWPLTTFCLFVGWPIFRSESLEGTLEIYRKFLFIAPEGTAEVDAGWGWLLLGCTLLHGLFYRRVGFERLARVPDWLFAIGYGAAWALILPWVATGYKAFIYFQF